MRAGWSSRRVDASRRSTSWRAVALLGLGVDERHRLADDLAGDPPAAKLGGERAAGQAAAGVPGVDPGRGERAVVDEADLGEAGQDRGGGVVGDAALGQRGGELRPGPRPQRQQPQADLAGHGLRVPQRILRMPRNIPDPRTPPPPTRLDPVDAPPRRPRLLIGWMDASGPGVAARCAASEGRTAS